MLCLSEALVNEELHKKRAFRLLFVVLIRLRRGRLQSKSRGRLQKMDFVPWQEESRSWAGDSTNGTAPAHGRLMTTSRGQKPLFEAVPALSYPFTSGHIISAWSIWSWGSS